MQRLDEEWGNELSDDDYARAIAAVHVVPLAPDRLGNLSQLVRERLEHDEPITLRLRNRVASTRPASDYAQAWRTATHELQPRLSVDADGSLLAWLSPRILAPATLLQPTNETHLDLVLRWLQRPSVGAQSVFAVTSNPAAELRADYPWRIRFLGRRVGAMTQHWSEHQFNERVFRVAQNTDPADLLFFDGPLRQALSQLFASPVAGDLLIVLGGVDTRDAATATHCRALMTELALGGVAVFDHPAPIADRNELVWRILEGLAHDLPLDVALNRAAAPPRRSPYLFCDARLPHAMKARTRLKAILDDIGTLPDDRVLGFEGHPSAVRFLAAISWRDRVETTARELADGLRTSIDAYEYHHESDEASFMGVLARTVEQATESDDETPRRFLQCRLVTRGDPVDLSRKAKATQAYAIQVRLGHASSEWLSGTVDLEIDDTPPDSPGGHRLTVVVWHSGTSRGPQVQHLWLPRTGNTVTLSFAVHLKSEERKVRARIIVLHKNRVLQSGEIVASLDSEGAQEFQLDALPRTRLARLEHRSRFDAALLLNGDDDGQQLTTLAQDQAEKINLDQEDFDDFTTFIAARLSAIAVNPSDYEGLDQAKTTDLLRALAQKGHRLQQILFDGHPQQKTIEAAGRIHLTCAKRTSFLPLELLYQHAPPLDDATTCPAALRQPDRCDGTTQTECPDDIQTVVCPFGFWGMNRVIERYSFSHQTTGANQLDCGEVTATRRRLPVLGGSVVSASQYANLQDADVVADLLATLGELQAPVERADDWKSWEEKIEGHPAGLLILLPHHLHANGFEYLEIGAAERLKSELVGEEHVAKPKRTPGPIVVLLGCKTQLAKIAFDNFVTAFSLAGAACVVSTVATVLGRHVGPTAEILARRVYHAAEQGGTLGEVMLHVRRAAVLNVSAMALGITAYGDADWQLTNQEDNHD